MKKLHTNFYIVIALLIHPSFIYSNDKPFRLESIQPKPLESPFSCSFSAPTTKRSPYDTLSSLAKQNRTIGSPQPCDPCADRSYQQPPVDIPRGFFTKLRYDFCAPSENCLKNWIGCMVFYNPLCCLCSTHEKLMCLCCLATCIKQKRN